ncbi:hypothetical protein AB5G97_02660 [Aeromonas veronii]|uniref:hypothetical protein n=1 Tax=Aeromonas veronii TaxID=654 RepID=UPI00366B6C55
MTERIKLALWCTWLSLFALPTWAAPQFTVPTVTKRVPANIEGTLNFASMQFWIETSKGERIMLMPLDEDEPRLIPKVSQPVALNGFMLTYSDGSRYFEPSFAPVSAASSTTSFTIVKNGDDNIEIRHGVRYCCAPMNMTPSNSRTVCRWPTGRRSCLSCTVAEWHARCSTSWLSPRRGR